MRKSRFNIGPSPEDSPISSPSKKQIPKYKKNPKIIQNSSPKADDPIARELENEEFNSDEDENSNTRHGSTVGLARAQLLIEYNSSLDTRERNIRNLAECIEKMMCT